MAVNMSVVDTAERRRLARTRTWKQKTQYRRPTWRRVSLDMCGQGRNGKVRYGEARQGRVTWGWRWVDLEVLCVLIRGQILTS